MVLMIALLQQKKNSINFSKTNTKLCLILHYNGDESYLYVYKTEICKFKANNNINWYNFYLGSISKDFTKDELSEISLNGTAYNFSVGHSSLKKKTFLNSPIFNG